MSEEKTKYCPYCGVQIENKYTVCPSCGKNQPQIDGVDRVQAPSRKNPLLAAILSLLITGLGQIYLGRVIRGLCYLVIVFLVGIFLSEILKFDELYLMIFGIIISIISAWDAYRLGKSINLS
jgi:TM2 domain-containing membrane protein YozV